MRLPDDDELYEVDQTYLGPPGRTIGPIRYKTIGAWVVIGPLLLVVLYKTVPLTFFTVALALMVITKLAMKFADWSTPERPVLSVFATAWNELTAKRRAHRGARTSAADYTARARPPRSVTRWLERTTKGAS